MENMRQFFTVRELARELNRTERTVREAIQRGEIPAQKICGRWVISVEALNVLLSANHCDKARRIY